MNNRKAYRRFQENLSCIQTNLKQVERDIAILNDTLAKARQLEDCKLPFSELQTCLNKLETNITVAKLYHTFLTDSLESAKIQ